MKRLLFLFVLFMLAACVTPDNSTPGQSSEQEQGKDDIIINATDTLEIKIGYDLSVSEEQIVPTRSEFGSRDLIAVQIFHLDKSNNQNYYACGIFDDLDNLIFKFVKGNSYRIQMTCYPNAKDFVYNYPDGTYGAPFSYLYGLQSYKVNEPVYYEGRDLNGNVHEGDISLFYIFQPVYQPTSDRHLQYFEYGMTDRYSGQEDIKIEDGLQITIPLYYCLMGITLNADNFTDGILSAVFGSDSGIFTWDVRPSDSHSIKFQIPFGPEVINPDDEKGYLTTYMTLFYINGAGEKYLLATKAFQCKIGVNYVLNFSLTEREDGSIGIQLPSDNTLTDEETSFD